VGGGENGVPARRKSIGGMENKCVSLFWGLVSSF
jgi:hypothetical protein